jgi:hypothetical protein
VGRDEVVCDGGKAGYGGEQSVAATKLVMAETKLSAQEVNLSAAKLYEPAMMNLSAAKLH